MQTSEMEDFEQQLGILCAGYNLPVTLHRKHAYFVGLAKMSLVQFTRVVEYAVSDDGPEDFPTSKGIWKLHRELLRGARATPAKPSDAHEPDHVEFLANRLLLDVGLDRGGFGPDVLGRLLGAKRALVNWYLGPIRDGDILATPNAFMQDFEKTVGQIVEISAKVRDRWQTTYSSEDALKPFPAHMGRQSTYIESFLPKNPTISNPQENLL